jgi:G3E family GTPase
LKLPGVSLDSEDEDSEIHRLKARLPLSNGEVKIVQGVRDIFEILDSHNPQVSPDDVTPNSSQGKIVLIGRHLSNKPFEESFLKTIE